VYWESKEDALLLSFKFLFKSIIIIKPDWETT
jgi:hypothetical protein